MKKCLSLALLVALILLPKYVYAAPYTSAADGDWSNVATWGGGGFPGAGDTATILAAHTVTIDGNNAVGTCPGNDTTYDLDIAGTLVWPAAPGANWTFTVCTSIKIQNGGTFRTGGELACADKARITMDTNGNQKYDIRVEDGGLLDLRGCEGYGNSTGTVERARISACSATPCTGAVTLTLDRDVNWDNCNADATYCAVIVGNGGNETTEPGGFESEIVTSYARPAGPANVISLTLANTHLVGDFVAKVTRNFLIDSNSTTTHGSVYSVGGEYYLSWIRLDEMGDSFASTTSALAFSHASNDLGTWEYVSLTNIDDGGNVAACYIDAESFVIDNVYIYDAAYAFRVLDSYIGAEITDGVMTHPAAHGLYGVYFTVSDTIMTFDGMWISQYNYGFNIYPAHVKNSLIHYSSSYGVKMNATTTYFGNEKIKVTDNEIRHMIGATGTGLYLSPPSLFVQNNNIDNCIDNCVFYDGIRRDVESYSNSFNTCNTSNVLGQAGVRVNNTAGTYYAVGDTFGSNTRANILWTANGVNGGEHGLFRGVCNECTFGAVANPPAGFDIPINLNTVTTWSNAVGISYGSYFTYHNKDSVEDDHGGWGPLGMYIEREAGTVVNNTLNLKVTPGSAIEYGRIQIGTTHLDAGEELEVQVQLRKTEAQADGRRPKLSLQGCGFEPSTDYDEMADVNNTWDTVSVSGLAAWKGTVHIYIEVKNELSGPSEYIPVWPPTLTIYADGFRYRKT